MAGKANPLSIRMPDGSKMQTSAQLVSIGSWAKNNIALDDASVSRRHALIANFPNDVWLYDLGSTRGTRLDGAVVTGRAGPFWMACTRSWWGALRSKSVRVPTCWFEPGCKGQGEHHGVDRRFRG